MAHTNTLRNCDAPRPCAESLAPLAEGGVLYINALREPECILDSLARRVPGIYRHETSHTWSTGSDSYMHLIRVQEDGQVFYAAYRLRATGDDEWFSDSHRCELRPAAFFEECLGLVEQLEVAPDTEGLKDCLYAERTLDQWFSNCEQAPAICH